MPQSAQKSIFLQALEEETPAARRAYLQAACGSDTALRASVEELLAAHLEPENLLDRPIAAPELQSSLLPGLNPTQATAASPLDAAEMLHVGITIGPYRLMEQIGEGGFGLVFVAQQESPVKRQVALKIVKPGTSSKEVLARFDAERQAVAMMDHPGIAKVFDAGVTQDGRPYFVMELVRGVPVSEFCDNHRLNLRQRLNLFCDLCAAVQHAHQKGVIHRDLKPSNVMVTLHDDKPVVKVIDFGVAKAIGHNLTDQTIYTRFYSMLGTPLYMSPEQAEMSGLDVDTRSDIFSLGVLLYELLTGTTPLDRQRLDSASYDEMRRIIREEEPPKPSKRLTTLGNRLSTVSETRHLEPSRLTSSIRGDLDWIVMKALEKDRSRRYESASAFADDVRRYLAQEPIVARPPSRSYRFMQFARRNSVAIATASLVASALVVGTVVSVYQASVAIAERKEKDRALSESRASERKANQAKLELENFNEGFIQANLLLASARSHEDANRLAEAAADYSQAIQLVPSYFQVWFERAHFYAKLDLWEEAASDFSAAIGLGAPVMADQWQGAGALLILTHRNHEFERLKQTQLQTQADNSPELDWNAIRTALAGPLTLQEAQQLAAGTRALLAEEEARRLADRTRNFLGEHIGPLAGPGGVIPWLAPEKPQRRGGPGESGPRGRGSDDIEGRQDGLRGQFGGRGPQFEPGGPGPPAGRGGPHNEHGPGRRPSMRLPPPGVQNYLACWAHTRAGQLDLAVQQLHLARQDQGWPVAHILDPLQAIIDHHAQRPDAAQAALDRSQANLNRWIDQLRAGEPHGAPWFDFAEAVLLHREASQLITGSAPEIDSNLAEHQQQMREKLLDTH